MYLIALDKPFYGIAYRKEQKETHIIFLEYPVSLYNQINKTVKFNLNTKYSTELNIIYHKK